jgi:dipeptidyl aminopeptidase/acylaminoacyl peptidase
MIIQTEGMIPGPNDRPITFDVTIPSTAGPHPVVIFAHGFKGFKDWGPFGLLARAFAEAGFAFVKFNFSFNGTTPERPHDFADPGAFSENNFTRELNDLNSIIDFTSHQHMEWQIDPDRLFLTGHSRGGGTVIIQSSEDPRVRGLATWASVSDFAGFLSIADHKVWKELGVVYVENARTGQQMPLSYQLYEDYTGNMERLSIESAVSKLDKPYLVVHGTADETVPFTHASALAALSSRVRLYAVPGANHTFGGSHPFGSAELPGHFAMVVKETIAFFSSL